MVFFQMTSNVPRKRSDDRKTWINSYEDGNLIDHTQKEAEHRGWLGGVGL